MRRKGRVRPAHDERDVDDVVVHDEVFVDHAVSAAHVAVVGCVDHERVVGDIHFFQLCEHPADLVIEQ